MKIAFLVTAAVMIAVALVTLLLPLVRNGRRMGRPRSVFALTLVIAFALPLASAGLYLLVGTPAALNGVSATPSTAPVDIEQAVLELRTHLTQQPDDLQAWTLLAQTQAMLRNPADARDAYDHVLRLSANNAEAMIGWAEADSMLRDDHLIEGRALDLLKRAVSLHPDSQRGLWLLGISDFQHERYADAAATWRLLQPQLQPGSTVAQAVAEQIALADSRASGGPATAASTAPADSASKAAPASPPGPALQVTVTLAPALKDKLAAGDVLFVYARAENGPPAPLAVARLDPSQLPTSITLTDAMAMLPTMNLSSASRVFVGARISRSGQPVAQPGDLEGDAGVVATDTRTPIAITIDTVH